MCDDTHCVMKEAIVGLTKKCKIYNDRKLIEESQLHQNSPSGIVESGC